VALAELHHLIERENRAPQAGAQFFSANRTRSTKCRCNSITAHHWDGPVRGRAERNAALVEVIKAYRRLGNDKTREGLERPQGTDGPACRSRNGADLRKGNHLVCRLPTLITPLAKVRYPRRPKISLRRMRNIDAGQRISNLRDKRGQAE